VDGRDQQQAEGIGQCPGPEDIGDTERHDEKAGQGEEEAGRSMARSLVSQV